MEEFRVAEHCLQYESLCHQPLYSKHLKGEYNVFIYYTNTCLTYILSVLIPH